VTKIFNPFYRLGLIFHLLLRYIIHYKHLHISQTLTLNHMTVHQSQKILLA